MGWIFSEGNGNRGSSACWRKKRPCATASCAKEMSNITDAVLAATLKELLRDGVIARRQYDEIPPRVEYTMTEKGQDGGSDFAEHLPMGGDLSQRKHRDGAAAMPKGATITPDKRTDKKQHDEAPVHWHGRILLPERRQRCIATLRMALKNSHLLPRIFPRYNESRTAPARGPSGRLCTLHLSGTQRRILAPFLPGRGFGRYCAAALAGGTAAAARALAIWVCTASGAGPP